MTLHDVHGTQTKYNNNSSQAVVIPAAALRVQAIAGCRTGPSKDRDAVAATVITSLHFFSTFVQVRWRRASSAIFVKASTLLSLMMPRCLPLLPGMRRTLPGPVVSLQQ